MFTLLLSACAFLPIAFRATTPSLFAFLAAGGQPPNFIVLLADAGAKLLLVDEEFGTDVAREAGKEGYVFAMPAEKSGQDEFDFEYGEDFERHIERFDPTFCKVLVRYNPAGERALNRRQAARLKRLSDHLAANGRSRFMFELLVPPLEAQLERVRGDKRVYDLELRPRLMVEAIHELRQEGVEPDVWKVEGLDRREDWEALVTAARAGGRNKVGCIVLGRGEDHAKVRHWLGVAAAAILVLIGGFLLRVVFVLSPEALHLASTVLPGRVT